MPNVILVPLDGSPASEQAVPLALAVARTSGSAVELVHVHEIPRPPGGAPSYDTTLDAAEAEFMRAPIADLAQRAASEHGQTVTARLLVGPAASTLERYAAERAARLIVMSTHGRGGLSRAWLGSVADRLVRHSTAPVLLVHPTESDAPTEPTWPPARVLVPLDGSTLAEEVLPPLSALIGPSAATMLLLLCVAGPVPPLDSFPDVAVLADEPGTSGAPAVTVAQSAEQAREYLGGIADRLSQRGLRVDTHVAIHPSAARAILEYAVERRVDLIALATHGRGGIARMLMGSVADKVIRGARGWVFATRPAHVSAASPDPEDSPAPASAP